MQVSLCLPLCRSFPICGQKVWRKIIIFFSNLQKLNKYIYLLKMKLKVCVFIGLAVVYLADESSGNDLGEKRKIKDQSIQFELRNEEIDDAEEFGIQEMNELFNVKEPKLFSNGVFLTDEHPARYVAAFNQQSDEAKDLAKVAYAALKGSKKLKEKFGNSTKDLVRKFKRPGSHKATLRERCPRKGSPTCGPASRKYRTADGSCNNFEHPWWGSAMSTMQRYLEPVYADGIESIRRSSRSGRPLPSPRVISALIHDDKDVPLASVTHMLMQWGQFIDHDMTATAQSRGFNGTFPQCCRNRGADFQPPELMHPDCLPIPINPEDNFFGRLGVRCLEFVRSGPAPREDCGFGPREQLSQVTSFLDASMVYSSNSAHSDSLRIFRNGLLQYGKIQSRKPHLPKAESDDFCRRGSLSTSCFRAGDARLSEQPALTSLHVVFLRLHNRMATELAAINPLWTDEKLFQESRKIIGAIVQHITYKEYLPIVLGPEVMKIFDLELTKNGYYEGYDPKVNPNIANSFSSAAYRFGHSLVQRGFARFDGHHRLINDNVTIHDEFKNRGDLQSVGSVDRLLLGLINQPAQRRDEFITEELTNHLFQFPGFPFGMDLAAINIQRGRDHGLAPYTEWREPCGLSPIRSWQELERVTSTTIAHKFQTIYENVEDIDLFSGGLAEKPVVGGLVGPTFACIIAQQFNNIRKGDRFWYENPHRENAFTPDQLEQIKRVNLGRILCRTLDNIDSVQPFVFLTSDTLRNSRVTCNDPRLSHINLEAWTERSSTKLNDEAKMLPWLRPKPTKTNINQKNRVTVKRPFGSNENMTLIVQNHYVHSPIYVNDAIYGSHLENLGINSGSRPEPIFGPPQVYYETVNTYPGSLISQMRPTRPSISVANNNNNNNPNENIKPIYEINRPQQGIDWTINPNIPNQQSWFDTAPSPNPSSSPPTRPSNVVYASRSNSNINSDENTDEIPKPLVDSTSSVNEENKYDGTYFDSLPSFENYFNMMGNDNLSSDEIPRPLILHGRGL